ncbi:MAG: hypothetical protein M3301_02610, partial [Chloroflexota bacterium]|nr:hypothetical protein [Chloroflexota bacterium]
VFEDLQWADTGLLDFIDHVLDWSRTIPLYVVTLARPELLDKRPDWGAAKRNFTSVYLEPLSEPAMRELLTGLVPGLPGSAVRAIVSRAEGVPLYAIETIRMLVAQGRLALADGVYRPSGDLTSLAVPETLTALIAARLDALDAPDRSLLQDAAVLGRSFTPQALAAIAGIDVQDLEPRLRALVRRELLAVEADPRSPERGQYAFVQALIREVAYNTLPNKERKLRHLAAARYFESIGTDELAGALAGHYLAAYQNTAPGAEADALAAQALISLKAAAERAANLGSYAQAVAFLEQALNVTSDPVEEADLLERAGDWASTASHHSTAERYLRRAVEIRRELGDRSSIARATAALGWALNNAYRADDAVTLLEPTADEFRDLANDPGVIAVGAQLARAYFLKEDRRRAIDAADQVLAAAERADLLSVVADTLITRGSALTMAGQTYEGIGAIETGERLAQAQGLTRTAYRAFLNRTEIQAHSDPRAGLEAARRGLELARRLGYRPWAVNLLGFTAAPCALRAGEWDWALGELDSSLADDEEGSQRAILSAWAIAFRVVLGEPAEARLGELTHLTRDETDPAIVSAVAAVRGLALLCSGDLDSAHEAFIEAREPNIQAALLLAARAAFWSGRPEKAREAAQLADGTGLHGPAINARRETLSAGFAAVEGRSDEAVQLYRQALRAWRELGLPWDEALTAIDMVTLLGPSAPDVVEVAESARQILTRLGARPFVDRLETALAQVPAQSLPRSRVAAPSRAT